MSLVLQFLDSDQVQSNTLSSIMSDTKAEATGLETAALASPPAKRSFGSRVAAHYKKWWWVHLIVFVIVVLVVALPV